jgi:hypothetical protein
MTRVRSLSGESYERIGSSRIWWRSNCRLSFIFCMSRGTNGLRAFTSIACVDGRVGRRKTYETQALGCGRTPGVYCARLWGDGRGMGAWSSRCLARDGGVQFGFPKLTCRKLLSEHTTCRRRRGLSCSGSRCCEVGKCDISVVSAMVSSGRQCWVSGSNLNI